MAKSKPKDVEVKTFIAKIDELITNDENPRRISKEAYEALKKSLRDFPEMKKLREIVVDEDMQIIGGHQRLFALKDLGYAEVTVKQVFGLTEEQKREFMIKDNTASGEWDQDIIADAWNIEQLEEWGVKNFNFGDIDEEPDEPPAKDADTDVHICPNCGIEFED